MNQEDYLPYLLANLSSLASTLISLKKRGCFRAPATPFKEAMSGYLTWVTLTSPVRSITKATLPLTSTPKCFLTAAGRVTWPLLLIVDTVSLEACLEVRFFILR